MFYKIYSDYVTYDPCTGRDSGNTLVNAYETLEEAKEHCPLNIHDNGTWIDYFITEVNNGVETKVWEQNQKI